MRSGVRQVVSSPITRARGGLRSRRRHRDAPLRSCASCGAAGRTGRCDVVQRANTPTSLPERVRRDGEEGHIERTLNATGVSAAMAADAARIARSQLALLVEVGDAFRVRPGGHGGRRPPMLRDLGVEQAATLRLVTITQPPAAGHRHRPQEFGTAPRAQRAYGESPGRFQSMTPGSSAHATPCSSSRSYGRSRYHAGKVSTANGGADDRAVMSASDPGRVVGSWQKPVIDPRTVLKACDRTSEEGAQGRCFMYAPLILEGGDKAMRLRASCLVLLVLISERVGPSCFVLGWAVLGAGANTGPAPPGPTNKNQDCRPACLHSGRAESCVHHRISAVTARWPG